jgi:16S rRNA (guanine527-N7)-methyltransferase
VTGHVVDSLTAVRSSARRRPTGHSTSARAAAIRARRGRAPADALLVVESVAKKARFLETVVATTALGGRVAVATARAEGLAADPRQRQAWPLVTARAVASLAVLVELAFPLLAEGGRLVAWKRGDVAAELAAARRATEALGGGRLESRHVTAPGLAGHLLVVATKTGPTPSAYPRDPAARDRRPW